MAKINGNFKIQTQYLSYPKNNKFEFHSIKDKQLQKLLQTLTNQRKRFRRFIFLMTIISFFGCLKLEL